MNLLFCVGGVALYSIFLLVEISLILSGESYFTFAEQEGEDSKEQAKAVDGSHIKAAVCIYLDVISITFFLLSMLADWYTDDASKVLL